MWVTPNSLYFPCVPVGPDVDDSLMFNKPDGSSNWVSVLSIGFNNEVLFGGKICKLRRGRVDTCWLCRIPSRDRVVLIAVRCSLRWIGVYRVHTLLGVGDL